MGTKGKRKRRRHRRRYYQRNLRLLLFAVVCVAVVMAAIQFLLGRYVKKYDDGTILSGVFIGDTDVSGMTKAEAIEAVGNTLSSCSGEKILLELDSNRNAEVTLEELGFLAPKLEATVDKAVKYGKTGNAFSAYRIIRKAQKNELEHHFALEYEVSKDKATRILEERITGMLHQPVNAAVTQTEAGVTIVKEIKGEILDAEKTIRNLNQYLNDTWDGKSGKVAVAVTEFDPELTEKDLKDVTDLLGTYTTFYGSDGSGRSQNVETGAMHINGTLLEPGEEMSANEAMEPYTYENGYAEAASYESNTVVQTMGGGICQVSTTLYNALLFAELEIVERYPHSMLVGYVEPSMDAAIADDILDLVFKNDQKTPIYIEAVLSNGALTFNIYGKETRDPGRTLKFISETTESKEPEGKRFVETEDPIGYMEHKSSAHSEISARLWKVVYVNGEEVSRDIINYSQYVAAPETIGIGTHSDNPEDTEKIKQALKSQDEGKIQAAIQEVLKAASPEAEKTESETGEAAATQ